MSAATDKPGADLTGPLKATLETWLAAAFGADTVSVTSAHKLSGGAIQDNWRLETDIAGGLRAGHHLMVLRTDAAARVPVSLDRAAEFEVLRAAHAAGVKVAEPLARCDDASLLGAQFLVQGFLPGNAQARRIVRDPELPAFGSALGSELARELALIHAVRPGPDAPSCLPLPALAPARTEVARLRAALEHSADPRPALEYVLAWLDRHAPPPAPLALVHGDFRTGNYMVDRQHLTGVLDWEFAHWGDPDEDLGWLCARCWRFGNDAMTVGGIASLEPFLDAYRTASGRTVRPDALRYWQIMAAAKWAAIAVLQGDRYRTGGESRLELALTGLMPAEMEHDALADILDWQAKGNPTWR